MKNSENKTKTNFGEIKESIRNIVEDYANLQKNFLVPEQVRAFVFYAPLKEADAPNLVGILFPKEDYNILRERIFMKNLNDTSEPNQYVGVSWDASKPFEVLEFAVNHIAESPQKILYENGKYVMTNKPLLSNPMNIAGIATSMAGWTMIFDDLTEKLKLD